MLPRSSSAQRQAMLPGWNSIAIAAAVGILIVAISWYLGPGLFGSAEAEQGSVVEATVTMPAECTKPDANETVRFEYRDKTRNGTLNACGHDQDQRVRILVPASAATSGLIDVTPADLSRGHNDPRRPVGLALVALSCFCGATYAFLVVRGPRTPIPT